jgi:hypothetical protein
MDKYIGDIILAERHDTRNRDVDAHSDEQFLRYNQYAQDRIYALITLSYNWVFEETALITPVANQDAYDIDDNLAFGTRITNVEYSANGVDRYYPLEVTPDRYRTLATTGRPKYYRRRHGQFVVEPTPDSTAGMFRATYERSLDALALRAGRVNGTPSGATIDLTHSVYGSPTAANEALFVGDTYICISDPYGVPLLYNGVISSYDSATDVITLAADVSTYLTEGTVLADLANGYLTIGKYTTTHSKLPNEAEAFLVEYVNRKLHNVDSSEQFEAANLLLREVTEAIVASFKFPDKARKRFPIDDFSMLIPEYD